MFKLTTFAWFVIFVSPLSLAESDGDPLCWKDARSEVEFELPQEAIAMVRVEVAGKIGEVKRSMRVLTPELPESLWKINKTLEDVKRWTDHVKGAVGNALANEVDKAVTSLVNSAIKDPPCVEYSGSFEYPKKRPWRGKWENLDCQKVSTTGIEGTGGAAVDTDAGVALGVSWTATVGFGGSVAVKLEFEPGAVKTRPPRTAPSLRVFSDTYWTVTTTYNVRVTVGVALSGGLGIVKRRRIGQTDALLHAGVELLMIPDQRVNFLPENCD